MQSSPSGAPGTELSHQFQQAADRVANLEPQQAAADMTTLYGLYKQATDGDHDTYRGEVGREDHDNPNGPAGLSQAQWDSWSQYKGMPKEEAMRRYVEEANRLAPADNRPTGSGKGDGPAPNQQTDQTAGKQPTTKPENEAPVGNAAGAANAGLRGDLRAGTPYGSEEELKEDPDAQEK